MKRILMVIVVLAAGCSFAAPVHAGQGVLGSGPILSNRPGEYNRPNLLRYDSSRSIYGYAPNPRYGFGPNYYGTGGFYGREYFGPGAGVYYRVPGGFGVYGY